MAAVGLLLVLARAKAGEAACPGCGAASARVHSRYARRLADAAVSGRRVVIRLTAQRFLQDAPSTPVRVADLQLVVLPGSG